MIGLTFANLVGVPASTWLGGVIGWRSVYLVIALIACIVAVAVWLAEPTGSRGTRVAAMEFATLFRNRKTAIDIVAMFLLMSAQFCTYALLAPYLLSTTPASNDLIPVAFMLFGLGGVFGNAVATRFADQLGAERMILGSLAALASVFLGMRLLADSQQLALSFLLLWAVFATMTMAPLSAHLVEVAPERRNLLLSLNASAIYLGIATGAAVGGIVEAWLGIEDLPLASLVFALTGLTVFAMFGRRTEPCSSETLK